MKCTLYLPLAQRRNVTTSLAIWLTVAGVPACSGDTKIIVHLLGEIGQNKGVALSVHPDLRQMLLNQPRFDIDWNPDSSIHISQGLEPGLNQILLNSI